MSGCPLRCRNHLIDDITLEKGTEGLAALQDVDSRAGQGLHRKRGVDGVHLGTSMVLPGCCCRQIGQPVDDEESLEDAQIPVDCSSIKIEGFARGGLH